ncbi:hypothetical protein [Aquirufa salirivi]|uniref:DUF4390 domain-containing protein n=1 Tax=Aquirufa salirivi TaxID=3104729 RepID=A0ABW8RYP8_9BACT
MKYWAGFLLIFCYYQSIWAQTVPPLQRESDDYSTYLTPNLETGLILLEANKERFQELMKQFQYQEFHRGYELEYLAPSSRVNQMRLIRKENNQVQFLFSPTKLHLIQQLEQALIARKAIISKDQVGMTWYKIPSQNLKSSNDLRVGIKLESDSEDRLGRTWTIWSTAVIFSLN